MHKGVEFDKFKENGLRTGTVKGGKLKKVETSMYRERMGNTSHLIIKKISCILFLRFKFLLVSLPGRFI